MAKKTVINLQDLKDALNDLKALKKSMEGPGNAWYQLDKIKNSKSDFGDLIEHSGPKIAGYIDGRTIAIQSALKLSTSGVDSAITLLNTTITNYERNEHAHKNAADGTATGGKSGSSSSGSNSGTGGRGGN